MKVTIRWRVRNPDTVRRIRERFGIPSRMTVNRETEADIRDEDIPLLRETARRGFINVIERKGEQ